jgi:hypothetical protein
MEPFRAVQAVLASNFQVMCQGEAQSHCCTQQAHETQCFRQHVPSPSSGHPKGTWNQQSRSTVLPGFSAATRKLRNSDAQR